MAYRYAIYFSPKHTALARFGASALGYDIHTGTKVDALSLQSLTADQWFAVTARARGYGFHATLKAPFRLSSDQDKHALCEAFDAFCEQHHIVSLPNLAVRAHHGFLAVTPSYQPKALLALERAIVEDFEPFRAPLTKAEIARRNPQRLSERQRQNLDRYGYPFVLHDFQFHMTLSKFVEGEAFASSLETELNDMLQQSLEADDSKLHSLTLAYQETPDAAFKALETKSLG